jgi:acrylyl-CoA reductase (NADPH)
MTPNSSGETLKDPLRALRIHADHTALETLSLASLTPGEVVIRVHWSGINYKDALAATRRAPIVRRPPLVGGIDLAGIVETSAVPQFRAGDAVLVTGCGLSETRDGGYATRARAPADAVVALPASLTLREAMAIGTAGFAAGLAVMQLQHNGLVPGSGPVIVSGASGGVGSIAIDLLAGQGHEVVALSRKPDEGGYLSGLGAREVLAPAALGIGTRPLEVERWAGAVDNVGGELLGTLLRSTRAGGSVAAVGLAASGELAVSLMPFLLRGVNLLGVNSSATPRPRRLEVWRRLSGDLRPRHLDRIVTRTVTLDELPGVFSGYLEGSVRGRTLVRMNADAE